MTAQERLEQARKAALAQRARLFGAASATRDRLMPARLADDAKARMITTAKVIKEDSIAHVRAHPVLSALSMAALAAWVARKPLMRHAPPLIARGYGWLSGKLAFSEWLATAEASDAEASSDHDPDNDNEDLPNG